jgi:hypothetical protein
MPVALAPLMALLAVALSWATVAVRVDADVAAGLGIERTVRRRSLGSRWVQAVGARG